MYCQAIIPGKDWPFVAGQGKYLLGHPGIRAAINDIIDSGSLTDVVDDIHHSNFFPGRFYGWNKGQWNFNLFICLALRTG